LVGGRQLFVCLLFVSSQQLQHSTSGISWVENGEFMLTLPSINIVQQTAKQAVLVVVSGGLFIAVQL
jgi:hypothetical protein